ncbi:MAG: NAD-dependent epimerase/dehydratase family protein [Muribaculaceae bacterium]|nr:NAD-dependent epimerase/dehydratase family protein [Muribaculaceae bacterium]
MRILVTGAAGFIGAAVVKRICETKDCDYYVVGLDNINSYYDISLKFSRLELLGIGRGHLRNGCSGRNVSDGVDDFSEKIDGFCAEKDNFPWLKRLKSDKYENLEFVRMNLHDAAAVDALFAEDRFDIVINLAAQAGVRYSITNPQAYIESNINGFFNILEGCRNYGVKHLVYASSSSVYGLNAKVPFSEHDCCQHPVSLYAATKMSNELMAHAYSSLYNIPTTGLRFFTVYGPWGRPDMSPFIFIDSIINSRPIQVFNNGDMQRDFTYIDDVVEGIVRILKIAPQPNDSWDAVLAAPATSRAPFRVYNIGNSSPINLIDYIGCIEQVVGKSAKKEMRPMQSGDVYQTYADSTSLSEVTGFRPSTSLKEGIKMTVDWFREYYHYDL